MNFAGESMNMMNVTIGFNKMGKSLLRLNAAAMGCDYKASKTENSLFESMLDSFMHPKKLTVTKGSKIQIDGVNIYAEMQGAFKNYISKDFQEFGKNIGVALAHTYLGVNDIAKLNSDSGQQAIDQTSRGGIPVFNKHIYEEEDNKRYVEYLKYITENGNANDPRRSIDEQRPVNILDILKPVKPADVPSYEDGEAWYETEEHDLNPQLILINLGAVYTANNVIQM